MRCIHKTLRVTPAMQAGITDRVWSLEDIVALMDAGAPKPGRARRTTSAEPESGEPMSLSKVARLWIVAS